MKEYNNDILFFENLKIHQIFKYILFEDNSLDNSDYYEYLKIISKILEFDNVFDNKSFFITILNKKNTNYGNGLTFKELISLLKLGTSSKYSMKDEQVYYEWLNSPESDRNQLKFLIISIIMKVNKLSLPDLFNVIIKDYGHIFNHLNIKDMEIIVQKLVNERYLIYEDTSLNLCMNNLQANNDNFNREIIHVKKNIEDGDMSYKLLSLYSLLKLDVSKYNILKLNKYEISIFDLITETQLPKIDKKDYQLLKSVNFELKQNFEKIDFNIFNSTNVFIHYGISKKNISKLGNSISKITANYDNHLWWRKRDLGSKFREKIIGIIELHNQTIKDTSLDLLIEHTILKILFNEKQISLENIKIKVVETIKVDGIDNKIISLLVSRAITNLELVNKIILDSGIVFFPANICYDSNAPIKYIYPKLKEILSQDILNIDILRKRLDGLTLQEISDIKNVTRERIRQIQVKLLDNLPILYEYIIYKEIFEEYEISEEIFIKTFKEDLDVYNFLKLKLKMGTSDFKKYIINSPDLNEKLKFELLEASGYFVDYKNDLIEIDINNLIIKVLFDYKLEAIKIEELLNYYNYYVSNTFSNYSELLIDKPRNLEGRIARLDNVIESSKKKVRFFEHNNVLGYLETLIGLLHIDDGCYTTLKIYKDNRQLMRDMDIQNEYELHNFFKKNIDKLPLNMELKRSPDFVIGDVTKYDFVEYHLDIFEGETKDELIEYFYDDYGFKKHTFNAYLSNNFKSRFIGETIQSNYKAEKEVVEQLKLKLLKDIYSFDEVKIIFQNLNIKFSTVILDEAGYYFTKKLIYSKTLGNAYNAILSKYSEVKIYTKGQNSFDLLPIISSYVHRAEKNRKLFYLGEEKYTSINYLKSKGINKKGINDFVDSIVLFSSSKKYFNLYSIQKEGFNNLLLDYGFNAEFYERIILTDDRIKVINHSSPKIFGFSKNNDASLNDFLWNYLYKYVGGTNLIDYIDDLNEDYGLEFNEENVKYRLITEGGYYSSAMEKMYKTKEDYLKEVYK